MATETEKETGAAHEVAEQAPQSETKRGARVRLKSYFEPTPKRFRVLGDSIAAASLFLAGLNIEHPKTMLIIGISGAIGKFVTNFFAE
jgi:hypothetical protein